MRNIYRYSWYLLDSDGQRVIDGFSFHASEGSAELFRRDFEKWNRLRKPSERLYCGIRERRQVTNKFAVYLNKMDGVLQYGVYIKADKPDPSRAISVSFGHRTLSEIFAEQRD